MAWSRGFENSRIGRVQGFYCEFFSVFLILFSSAPARATSGPSEPASASPLCCGVLEAFARYVAADKGDRQETCAGQAAGWKCLDSAPIRYVLGEVEGIGEFVTSTGTDLAFAVEGDAAAQADLLLFAQLGRSYTRGVMPERGDGEQDNIFFKFHAASSTIHAVHPACAFEKSVYLTMIVLTVVVLVVLILQRHVAKLWRNSGGRQGGDAHGEREAAAKAQGPVGVAGAARALNAGPAIVVDFGAGLRQR